MGRDRSSLDAVLSLMRSPIGKVNMHIAGLPWRPISSDAEESVYFLLISRDCTN